MHPSRDNKILIGKKENDIIIICRMHPSPDNEIQVGKKEGARIIIYRNQPESFDKHL